MADVPQTLALIVLAQEYRGNIVRNINRKAMFLSTIPIVIGGGQNVSWVPEGDGQLAEGYNEGADAASFGSDSQLSAVLSWGQYRSNFAVTGLAKATARTAAQPTGNQALWARNLVNSSSKLAEFLNQQCFNGSSRIIGLDTAIATDGNAYASINRAVDTFFDPYVVDPGVLTAPSLALIRNDLATIEDNSGETPDMAFMKPNILNRVAGIFDPQRQYSFDIQNARGPLKLDGSKGAVEVDGCLFVKDKDATANRIYYVNTNHVEVQVLPGEIDAATNSAVNAGATLPANDGFGLIPLQFQYEMLAKTGDKDKAEVRCYIQLKVERPNSCGARLNVAA